MTVKVMAPLNFSQPVQRWLTVDPIFVDPVDAEGFYGDDTLIIPFTLGTSKKNYGVALGTGSSSPAVLRKWVVSENVDGSNPVPGESGDGRTSINRTYRPSDPRSKIKAGVSYFMIVTNQGENPDADCNAFIRASLT